jgi:hypothetical protein
MNTQEQHHDLALKLLVGRSLSTGLPWSVEEDRSLILQERILWGSLTPEQQQQEQQFLASFWKGKGAKRIAPVNRDWGIWTKKLPDQIEIPDSAFGLAHHSFRPWLKGSWAETDPALATFLQWLWDRGFQVVYCDQTTITLIIPAHRLIQESERLMSLLGKTYGLEQLEPWGGPDHKLQIRSIYDPVSGQALMEISSLGLRS